MSESSPFRLLALSLLWSVAATLTLGATDLSAQNVVVNEECHCTIDSDGNQDCSCTTSEGPRVRIGIGLDPNQSAEHDALGVLVLSVLKDSPAEKSGLREGDVVTTLQGRSLLASLGKEEVESDFDPDRSTPVQRLQAIAGGLEPGDKIEIGYERDGDSHIAELVAETTPSRTMRLELDGLPGSLADRVHSLGDRTEAAVSRRFRRLQDHASSEDRGDGRREIRILRHDGGDVEMNRLSEDEVHVWRGVGESGAAEKILHRIAEEGDEREIVLSGVFEGLEGLHASGGPGVFEFEGLEGLRAGGGRAIFVGRGPLNSSELKLVKLEAKVAEYFGTDRGVLVADVDEDSSLGLEAGDVILEVGERLVDSPGKVRRILHSYDPGEMVTFGIMRNHEEMRVEGHRSR